MKFLNKVSCPAISVVLLLMPVSQAVALNLTNKNLAQAQAWQCRADWKAGGSTYSRVSATESEAGQDLDREVRKDSVNNNGQNTISNKTCFTVRLPDSPSSQPKTVMRPNPRATGAYYTKRIGEHCQWLLNQKGGRPDWWNLIESSARRDAGNDTDYYRKRIADHCEWYLNDKAQGHTDWWNAIEDSARRDAGLPLVRK